MRSVGPDGDARARLLGGVPVSERRIEAAGSSTVVLEGGGGPPLVLLHGGIECGGVYWAPVVASLAERNRVVVPDVPGLGESDPVERLDAASFTRWLDDVLAKTCDEEPVVIAHSLVGTLAARFAARHAALLRGLVLYGAPGVARYRLPLGLRLSAIRLAVRPTARNLERFLPWPFLDPDRTRSRDPDWFEAFLAYLLSCSRVPHSKRAMRTLVRTCTRKVPDSELRRIDVPTELVWGRHDRMTPLSLGEEASGRLGWPLRVIDDAGHVPHVERPLVFVKNAPYEPVTSRANASNASR